MSDRPERKISELAVPRLSRYYRALVSAQEKEVISSEEIADLTGTSAPQIRKDLTHFGQFGRPGLGYHVQDLKKALTQILGLDHTWNVALIGVGHLGEALLKYKGFRRTGFHLVAAYDRDSQKIGRSINGILVRPLSEMKQGLLDEHVGMCVLTVPGEEARSVSQLLAESGVRAILNFAPVMLDVPTSVTVHNIDVSVELEKLSFLASRSRRHSDSGIKGSSE